MDDKTADNLTFLFLQALATRRERKKIFDEWDSYSKAERIQSSAYLEKLEYREKLVNALAFEVEKQSLTSKIEPFYHAVLRLMDSMKAMDQVKVTGNGLMKPN